MGETHKMNEESGDVVLHSSSEFHLGSYGWAPWAPFKWSPVWCHTIVIAFLGFGASSCFSCFVFSMLASAQMIKNPPGERPGFDPWAGKIPCRREQLPTPVFLPGEFHGQRSLASYSPWSHKESDMTEWLEFASNLLADSEPRLPGFVCLHVSIRPSVCVLTHGLHLWVCCVCVLVYMPGTEFSLLPVHLILYLEYFSCP